jgi:multiple sugar transport system substrate-binding protein
MVTVNTAIERRIPVGRRSPSRSGTKEETMRRRQLICASIGALAGALANTARADQFGPDSAPIHITWQMQPTQSPKSSVPAVKEYFQSHIEAWAKAHPDVMLDVSFNSADINASMTRMQEQAAAGRAPDVAMLDSFFVSRFYQYLQPLDRFYGPDQVNDFVAYARNGMRGPDGKLRALWVNTDVRVLHYRKDLVSTPPKTWDELIATAADLSKRGLTGYLYPGGRGEGNIMEHLPMFWAQGGELVDAGGKPVFGAGNNRVAMLNVLNFLKRTIDSGASPNRVVNYRFEADLYPEILQGKVAMFLGGSWMVQQLRGLGDKAEWGIAPIPLMTPGDPVTAAGGWTYAVFTPDAKKQDLIIDLVNSLVASPDAMAASTAALGNLPTRTSVAHGDYAYVKTPLVHGFLDLLRYGRARPGAIIYPSISTELQVAISDVITGQQTPEAALDQAWHKLAP